MDNFLNVRVVQKQLPTLIANGTTIQLYYDYVFGAGTTSSSSTTQSSPGDPPSRPPGDPELTPTPGDITFTDANLHHAVLHAFSLIDYSRYEHKDDHNNLPLITGADAITRTVLKADSKGITNLGGLEHLKALTSLNLSGNEITDITGLLLLERLTSLNLSGNTPPFRDDDATIVELREERKVSVSL